jgi:hypothetical protein
LAKDNERFRMLNKVMGSSAESYFKDHVKRRISTIPPLENLLRKMHFQHSLIYDVKQTYCGILVIMNMYISKEVKIYIK